LEPNLEKQGFFTGTPQAAEGPQKCQTVPKQRLNKVRTARGKANADHALVEGVWGLL